MGCDCGGAAHRTLPRRHDARTRDYDGEQIKQADANLLGWPLGIVADRESLLRDLRYYEPRIDPAHGPAMSHSALAIQYARLGMAGKALEMFRRSYRPNLRPPFGVLSETAASDNPYFMTAAGGLLQTVLFGFGGLEITDEGVAEPAAHLPPGWKKLTVRRAGR